MMVLGSYLPSAMADDPECIVSIGLFQETEQGETPISGAFVKVLNKETEQYLSGYTDGTGLYEFDLDDLPYGWQIDDEIAGSFKYQDYEGGSDFLALDGYIDIRGILPCIMNYPWQQAAHWFQGQGGLVHGKESMIGGYRPWRVDEGPGLNLWYCPFTFKYSEPRVSASPGWVWFEVWAGKTCGPAKSQWTTGQQLLGWDTSPTTAQRDVWIEIDDIDYHGQAWYENGEYTTFENEQGSLDYFNYPATWRLYYDV